MAAAREQRRRKQRLRAQAAAKNCSVSQDRLRAKYGRVRGFELVYEGGCRRGDVKHSKTERSERLGTRQAMGLPH
jgi:hypothetical protein